MMQTIVDGILQGAVLSLAAAGFSLIFGVMNVLNLTHGVAVIFGAYLALIAWTWFGIDPLFALGPIALISFCLGYAYQRTILQVAIRRGSLLSTLIVTLGVGLILRDLISVVFSPDIQSIRPSYAVAHMQVGGLTISAVYAIAFVVSLVLIGILALILEHSPLGRMIRATAQQELAAKLCGLNVEHVYGLTFGLATAFAGAAGVIVGILYPFTPATEQYWTIYAFVVVVLGGIGSTAGVLLGGILLGIVSTLTSAFIGPAFPNAMIFAVLVTMLIVRPTGLLGSSLGLSR